MNIKDIKTIADWSVQYSFKYDNSNLKGGLRIDDTHKSNLPYISGRTLLDQNISLYCDGLNLAPGKSIDGKKIQYNHMLYVPHNKLKSFNEEQKSDIETYNNLISKKYENNCDILQTRQKQLLIKKGNSYISLTPVSPISLSYMIRTKLSTEKDLWENNKKEYLKSLKDEKPSKYLGSFSSKFKYVNLEIGGTKPVNVGKYAATKSLYSYYFKPPQVNKDIRKYYAIHYNGTNLKLNDKIIKPYLEFLKQSRDSNSFGDKWSTKVERTIIFKICKTIDDYYINIFNQLNDNILKLPNETILDENVSNLNKGLIIKEYRDSKWIDEMAKTLSEMLVNYKTVDGLSLYLNDRSKLIISNIIKNYYA